MITPMDLLVATLSLVPLIGDDEPEQSLWEERGCPCKYVFTNKYIFSDFETDAKVCISKTRKGIGRLKRCA